MLTLDTLQVVSLSATAVLLGVMALLPSAVQG
jgi:hypothetical protein